MFGIIVILVILIDVFACVNVKNISETLSYAANCRLI